MRANSAFFLVSDPRVVALHLVGNAVLIASAAFWLLIPEASVMQLLFGAVSALLIVFLFAWLHTGTLAFAHARDALRASFRRALARVPLFVVLLLAMVWCISAVHDLRSYSIQVAGYLFAKMPNAMRPASGVDGVSEWVDACIVTMTWLVVPALFLPLLAAVSAQGVRGMLRGALRIYRRPIYWGGVLLIGVAGVWIPQLLVDWKPGTGLRAETISMVVRLAVAYAVAVSAWLAVAGLLGGLLRDATPTSQGGGQSIAQPAD